MTRSGRHHAGVAAYSVIFLLGIFLSGNNPECSPERMVVEQFRSRLVLRQIQVAQGESIATGLRDVFALPTDRLALCSFFGRAKGLDMVCGSWNTSPAWLQK